MVICSCGTFFLSNHMIDSTVSTLFINWSSVKGFKIRVDDRSVITQEICFASFFYKIVEISVFCKASIKALIQFHSNPFKVARTQFTHHDEMSRCPNQEDLFVNKRIGIRLRYREVESKFWWDLAGWWSRIALNLHQGGGFHQARDQPDAWQFFHTHPITNYPGYQSKGHIILRSLFPLAL